MSESEDDYSRRTLLAVERTYLAWWRTGLTALAVALATARVVPELSKAKTQWPYTLLGIGFALLGAVCIAYAERRRRTLGRVVREGDYDEADARITAALAVGGLALSLGLVVVLAVQP